MSKFQQFEEEEQDGYLKIDQYNEKNVERIAEHYKDILQALGKTTGGLFKKNPRNVLPKLYNS